ncbi:N-6 DNA methylase [Aequorivita sinensis]|uniref:N-6 DNA methylase n=1 Tax=Aequorivita sinensis TaxID=1382458 RepID=UPI001123ABFD|nr:N-6 DNA methylase [Aequorivita sinensis]
MSSIENKFWGALDSVRGYRDIRDLRELYLSLVFLKYSNDRALANDYSPIVVPEKAQWDNLYAAIGTPDIFNNIMNALHALEYENPILNNTFSAFDFSYKFNNKSDFKFISDIVKELSNFAYSANKISFTSLFSSLLINFAKNQGKVGGDSITPFSVSKLMIELLNPKKGSVLDSACGTGGFFQNISQLYPNGSFQFYGQDINATALAIAKLYIAFNDDISIQFSQPFSTLSKDVFPDLKADFVLMSPPLSLRTKVDEINSEDPRFKFGLPPRSNANLAWIQHAIYHLNKNGKAAILLNNNSLTSGGMDREIRKKIIEANVVEAIITLPSQLLTNTSIPVSIWVLNKNKPRGKEVLFIDASNLGQMLNRAQRELSNEDIDKIVSLFKGWQDGGIEKTNIIGFSNSVQLNEIAENEYSLAPTEFIRLPELSDIDLSKAVKLSHVLDVVRPSRLDHKEIYRQISIKDLSSNIDSYLLDPDVLEKGKARKGYHLLPENVLLISRLGDKIKPTYYKFSNHKLAFSSNGIYLFKVDTNLVLLDYLIAELHKEYVQAQLESFRRGAGILMITRKDLLKVKVVIPNSKEEQKEIFEKEREIRFQKVTRELGFENEITKLKEAQFDDLGSKKHNILQHLNNVKTSVDILSKMMEVSNGVLRADEVIDAKRGVTVQKRFFRLQESLEKVIYYVDNITNEISHDNAEIFNPIEYLNVCKERGVQNDLFSIEIIVEKETFGGAEPLISISKNDFEEIYNNLLENAISHGFINKSKVYNFRITISYIDRFLVINFTNNGKPFSKGIANKIHVKGEKAGITGGTGIGLWKVAEIAKHFNCKLEVIDEPESEFPVGFKFHFKLETL